MSDTTEEAAVHGALSARYAETHPQIENRFQALTTSGQVFEDVVLTEDEMNYITLILADVKGEFPSDEEISRAFLEFTGMKITYILFRNIFIDKQDKIGWAIDPETLLMEFYQKAPLAEPS